MGKAEVRRPLCAQAGAAARCVCPCPCAPPPGSSRRDHTKVSESLFFFEFSFQQNLPFLAKPNLFKPNRPTFPANRRTPLGTTDTRERVPLGTISIDPGPDSFLHAPPQRALGGAGPGAPHTRRRPRSDRVCGQLRETRVWTRCPAARRGRARKPPHRPRPGWLGVVSCLRA